MKTFSQFNEGRAQDMQQRVKDKIKPEFHDKYDFKKIKNSQTMLNALNRAKMYKHLKENANQERVREKIKAEKEADKEKHDRMMDRARTRDTRVANAKEEVELDEASLRKSIATNSGKFPEGSNVKHSKTGKVGKVLTAGKDFVKVAHGNRQKDYHPSELHKIDEAKYSVDVDGLPRFYMDADSPAQVKIALRKLLKKASDIDSVERVNDATIKQDLRQRLKGGETDKRYVDEGKKKGLWYNIHQKRKRGEKPNPPGHPDRPTAQDFKDAAKTSKKGD